MVQRVLERQLSLGQGLEQLLVGRSGRYGSSRQQRTRQHTRPLRDIRFIIERSPSSTRPPAFRDFDKAAAAHDIRSRRAIFAATGLTGKVQRRMALRAVRNGLGLSKGGAASLRSAATEVALPSDE